MIKKGYAGILPLSFSAFRSITGPKIRILIAIKDKRKK
jgi:hypothetical protein